MEQTLRTLRTFRLFDEMDDDFPETLNGPHRSMAMKHAIHQAHRRLGIRPLSTVDTDRMHRLLYEITINAVQHVRRSTVELPWNVTASLEEDRVEWTVKDEGQGILTTFLQRHDGDRFLQHHGNREDLLLAIIHERLTSFCADPNAGIGFSIALRNAQQLGAELTLRTDGMHLIWDGDSMIVTGCEDTSGTTWTIRISDVCFQHA